jgi:hypothetical protein
MLGDFMPTYKIFFAFQGEMRLSWANLIKWDAQKYSEGKIAGGNIVWYSAAGMNRRELDF